MSDDLAVLDRRADAKQRLELLEGLRHAADVKYSRDRWAWLTEQVNTLDEASNKVHRFPDKPYLKELGECLDECSAVAIPKSRRMMVTWGVAAWAVHRARFVPHNAIFWQADTESKAAFVVGQRCGFIEDHLEFPELKHQYTSLKTVNGEMGRMTYPDTESYIWGLAQGADKLRLYTYSVLVMDECEFQPEGQLALNAALPALEKGSKLILISSSNGPAGPLASICREVGFVRFA